MCIIRIILDVQIVHHISCNHYPKHFCIENTFLEMLTIGIVTRSAAFNLYCVRYALTFTLNELCVCVGVCVCVCVHYCVLSYHHLLIVAKCRYQSVATCRQEK